MKRKSYFLCWSLVAATLVSCDADTPGNSGNWSKEQSFTVVVESVGELFTGSTESVQPTLSTRRPITSVTPTQTFDKLTVLIAEYQSPAKVVFKKTVEDWSNPNNKSSIPWSTDDGQGRYATITLGENSFLEEGKTYIAYAIGYQTGTYGDYEPFRGIEVGDLLDRTETASVPQDGYPEEIFAGAEILFVQDGVILSRLSAEAEAQHGLLVARRQVAGTFGYFTHIPVQIEGQKVSKLRLVSTKQNQTVIFGGFRGLDDSYNFHKDNVINGMNPAVDYDCRLAGSEKKDAFKVYEIELCKWFPGNKEHENLPLDANKDGYLDAKDFNWQIDKVAYPAGTISLAKGSVFGDSFWLPLVMTQEDIESGIPTFQMQLLDETDRILKSWNIVLRDYETAGEDRTLVSLPNGETGRTVISGLENIDTETCFSIVRNRLYTMGEKNQSQNYGEDEPIDLDAADVLVLDSRHEWRIVNSIIFN